MTNRAEFDGARKAFGERLRSMRKEQKMTVRGFALMVGLSKDYIIDLEYGRKSPTFDTIVKISAGLDVSPSELLRGIGEPPSNGNSAPEYYHTKL